MKTKCKLILITMLLLLISGCNKKDKDIIKTFELNFSTNIFSAYLNEELLTKRIHEENTLIFEPKNEFEKSFISIQAKESSKTSEECMEYLQKYKNSLEEKGNKITIINEEITNNVAFLTYSILSKNGNITTIYSKSMSNEDNSMIVIYYQCYSESEKYNLALKDSFDSITIN